MARRANEAAAIRMDNAATGTTSAPSAATDGIQVPESWHVHGRFHLELRKGAAAGTRTARVKVWGYRSTLLASYGGAEIASSGAWVELYDTGTHTDAAANFNVDHVLYGLGDWERVATQIVTNGGTTPTLTTAIGFARAVDR